MDRKLNLNRAETFSFVNPWIRYFLFFFSFLFWTRPVAEHCSPNPSGLCPLASLGLTKLATSHTIRWEKPYPSL
ncbi:tetraspanin-33-like protein [Lates japonicus]|uniref:Tetraspanin-33-like protein n=1 Tax=Lates japonicus TaxID=270547 RepID=A0AAD3MVJ6_LATJO|nr:tetraspanin-33-like protein [Lates japonicus]